VNISRFSLIRDILKRTLYSSWSELPNDILELGQLVVPIKINSVSGKCLIGPLNNFGRASTIDRILIGEDFGIS
jgi:hypothetical protein